MFILAASTIILIACGSALVMLIGIAVLVIVVVRRSHGRRLRYIEAAGEREINDRNRNRLSLCPSEMSAAVRTGSVVHRPDGRNVYTRGWLAFPAKENSGTQHSQVSSLEYQNDKLASQHKSDVPTWPVPRRLARSQPTGVASSKSYLTLQLSPIPERHHRSQRSVNTVSVSASPTKPIQQPIRATLRPEKGGNLQSNLSKSESPMNDLRPKPLFSTSSKKALYDSIDKSSEQPQTPFDSGVSPIKRTMSLLSQRSGEAPLYRLPSPAPALPHQSYVGCLHPHATSALTRQLSSNSTSTCGSSIIEALELDSGASRAAPRRNGIPPTLDESKRAPHIFTAGWDYSNDPSTTTKIVAYNAAAILQNRVASQQAFVKHYQLPRRHRSGPTPPLIDRLGILRSESECSDTDGYSETLIADARTISTEWENHLATSASALKQPLTVSRARVGEDSPFSRDTIVDKKRASASVLSTVSGNQHGPARVDIEKRPSSWGTVPPSSKRSFVDSPKSLRKEPSKPRIATNPSSQESFEHGPITPATDKGRKEIILPKFPGLFVDTIASSNDRPSLHPPSVSTFDPEIDWLSLARPSSTKFSNLFSLALPIETRDVKNHDMTAPKTPTRKPSTHRRETQAKSDAYTGVLANSPNWPLPIPFLPPPSPSPAHREPTNPSNAFPPSLPSGFSSGVRPSTYTGPLSLNTTNETFWSPRWRFQAPLNIPSPTALRAIKGPRRNPSAGRTRSRSPIKKSSPLRNMTKIHPPSPITETVLREGSKENGSIPGSEDTLDQDLHSNIMALRRMNSDAPEYDREERRNYLNLGRSSTLPEINDIRESQSRSETPTKARPLFALRDLLTPDIIAELDKENDDSTSRRRRNVFLEDRLSPVGSKRNASSRRRGRDGGSKRAARSVGKIEETVEKRKRHSLYGGLQGSLYDSEGFLNEGGLLIESI
ncbi:hypothetical protein MMC25_006683 [Agyrium rufum]|nr:hypothetical protein [Agyrium rufum]